MQKTAGYTNPPFKFLIFVFAADIFLEKCVAVMKPRPLIENFRRKISVKNRLLPITALRAVPPKISVFQCCLIERY